MARNGYRNGNGNDNGRDNHGHGSMDRQPTIGEMTDETSYPHLDPGEIGEANLSLGVGAHNYNASNFVCDPAVLNESPSMKKSYAWNRGEEGNANG